MASRTITGLNVRLAGETAFIQDTNGEVRNFLAAPITTEANFTNANRINWLAQNPPVDPLEGEVAEIRIIASYGSDGEESRFSYYNSEFCIYPFSGLGQDMAFEILPDLNRGDSIRVAISPTNGFMYFKNGSPQAQDDDGAVQSELGATRRPPPVYEGDAGTVHGVLPFTWRPTDPYSPIFAQGDRMLDPVNNGRPLRYNTYFSVDTCNQLLLNNPRWQQDSSTWPAAKQIAPNRFAREPADILAKKSKLLIYATQFMDVAHEWRGVRATWHQALEHPRWHLYSRSGYFWLPERIPDKIRQAYADFAYELSREDRLLETIEPESTNLNSIAAGNVSLSFNSKDRKAIVPHYIEVQVEEFVTRYFASNPVSFDVPY